MYLANIFLLKWLLPVLYYVMILVDGWSWQWILEKKFSKLTVSTKKEQIIVERIFALCVLFTVEDNPLFFVFSRDLAMTSPYFEALQKKDTEVLFLYEPYDELVLMNLGQFDRKNLKSVENEIQDEKDDTNTVDESGEFILTIILNLN